MPSPLSKTPQLTLEDVARDAFRREFFLDAFADEREVLELSFSFLQRVREYKQLLGRREALQSLAEEIVDVYLRDPPAHLCVYLHSTSTASLLQRIVAAVDSNHSTPDLFFSVENQVSDRLEKDKFVAFLQTPQYGQLCTAVRKHRELPLGEILVDARRTSYLEQFLTQDDESAIGNLLFWVEVQTVFLPLIQTNVVSVALFEEIQATVRRLYNQFLTQSSSTMAAILPEIVRKDILKRIVQLQGEPFSPSRYATLFRQAQEKIWHWLQTVVWPKFQASMFYVALVVETENLESDRQLRKLSEHVQATTGSSAASTSKSGAIFIPVTPSPTQRPTHVARYVPAIAPSYSEGKPRLWRKELRLPLHLRQAHVQAIRVIEANYATIGEPVDFDYILNTTLDDDRDTEFDNIDCMDFIWNWRRYVSVPIVLSPSHRPHFAGPKPKVHSFSVPMSSKCDSVYGYVMTVWPQVNSNTTAIERFANSEGPRDSTTSANQQILVPRFVVLLASQSLDENLVSCGLKQIADLPVDEIDQDIIDNTFRTLTGEHHSVGECLRPQFSGFYMSTLLHPVNLPIHRVLQELSHQTVIALLAALLVGKSLVIVCPRSAALVLVANALLELLKPFDWQHLFLPLCPARTACALADRSFFTSLTSSSSIRGDRLPQCPFIIGLEAELGHQKSKELANEPRHRIRNSTYSVQRVNLQLYRPSLNHSHTICCHDPDSFTYPLEILHTQAIVLDVDADDIYTPERVEIPEFPQGLVRTLELSLKDAMNDGKLGTEDSRVFSSSLSRPSFVTMMLEPKEHDSVVLYGIVDFVRLAVLGFMESLVGDVIYYFCSVHKHFANDTTPCIDREPSHQQDWYIMFEVDLFLDSKIEVGCREFYRQVFQTEAFRQFLLRQHHRFCNNNSKN